MLWIVLFIIITYANCAVMDSNLSSGFVDDPQYGTPLSDLEVKSVKRRQAIGDWCVVPPPLRNGKYKPSRNRCPPTEKTPACLLTEGAYVYPNWVIHLDYCDKGYVVNTTNTVSACVNGTWLPRLPTCVACPPSDTLVYGKPVCRGDVIFEEDFSRPLIINKWRKGSKWLHYIYLGDSEWQFNTFTEDIKNSFTSNGSLVIKPTVYHDDHVTSGSVELDGCHDEGDPKKCARTASPDRILPPVATAGLRTTFRFTYGQVEIRAKLPKGDWLIPEFTLEPTYPDYGAGASSGSVEMGVSLGNSDLTCGGEDYGHGVIGSRIGFGPKGKVTYKEFIVKDRSDKWHDEYHNYTVIWKPGSVAFKIDNELLGVVAPHGETLCEDYEGLTKEDCTIYSNGTSLAPFDKDFFIGLRLTAADFNSFTDGCMNRGKLKPWKHDEPEAVLKFWKDRQNWLPTWTEDGSCLYIDHVRVTAV